VRLFVSVPLPARQRHHLLAALDGRATTRADQWHLTLAFLADHDDPEGLAEGLRRVAAGHRPFRLNVEGGGTFQGPGVLWAGVAGDLASLRRLASDVAATCGAAADLKPFRPHVTVARRGPASLLTGYQGPEWTVGSIDLVHSVLTRTAEHVVLERFSLGTG
jgi:2'-5' RNA ligase